MTDEKKRKPLTLTRDVEMLLGPGEHQGLFKTAISSAAELMESLEAKPVGVWIALHLVRLDPDAAPDVPAAKWQHGPTLALGLPGSMPIKTRAWLTRQAANQMVQLAEEMEAEAARTGGRDA